MDEPLSAPDSGEKSIARSGEPSYFFDEGLRFACQQCGKCCTGREGIVRVSDDDCRQIADLLGLPAETFIARYGREAGGLLSLREKENGDCIFYEQGCGIYPARPVQCRTFPFWLRNLRNEGAWKEASQACSGIGRGPLYSREEILDQVSRSPA